MLLFTVTSVVYKTIPTEVQAGFGATATKSSRKALLTILNKPLTYPLWFMPLFVKVLAVKVLSSLWLGTPSQYGKDILPDRISTRWRGSFGLSTLPRAGGFCTSKITPVFTHPGLPRRGLLATASRSLTGRLTALQKSGSSAPLNFNLI